MVPGSSLQAVSAGGHKALIQLLLEKNVDVHLQGGEYGNVLQAASAGGHEAVIWLLQESRRQWGFLGPDWLEGHMHIT